MQKHKIKLDFGKRKKKARAEGIGNQTLQQFFVIIPKLINAFKLDTS